MKKMLLLAAVMFAAVTFSACSDDDNKGEKTQSLVSGNTHILRAMITA